MTDACVKCGKCLQACSFGAINDDFSTRFLNCTSCRSCRRACPAGAIRFTLRWRDEEDLPAAKGASSEAVFSRRGVLAGLGGAVVAGAGASLAAGGTSGGPDANPPIRPPGSVPEDRFLQLCVRCGQCIKVCPNNVLQPAGFEHGFNGLWTPKVVADWSGCEPSCNNCGQVCPTGAVRALTLDEKRAARIGLAQVDQHTCLPYAGQGSCQLCVDECRMAGYDAIEFIRVGGELDERGEPVEGSGRLAPVVREDRCVGCGLCQMRCHAINVKVKHLLKHSAIQVLAGEGKEDRIMSGSYIALRNERARQRSRESPGRRGIRGVLAGLSEVAIHSLPPAGPNDTPSGGAFAVCTLCGNARTQTWLSSSRACWTADSGVRDERETSPRRQSVARLQTSRYTACG